MYNPYYRKVLVLNKCWTALRTAQIRDAFRLIFGERNGEPKARIIDTNNHFAVYDWNEWAELDPSQDEDFIRSAGGRIFKVPKVILLSHYDKIPNHKVNFSKKSVYKRDQYCCQYCHNRIDSDDLSLDHVIPRSKGGETTWENVVLACIKCNVKKADKTLEEAGMKLLKNPVKPKYQALFKSGDEIPKEWRFFI